MRPFRTSLATLAFCAIVSIAAGEEPMLEGRYTPIPERSDDIEAAIEAAVDDMNFIKRPIARSRLRKTNPAYQRIIIGRKASDVEVTFDKGSAITSPADGTPVKWKREDGEVFEVKTHWQAKKLTQNFKAEDGERTNTFHLNADGELVLDVKIKSDQLPKPLTYSLVYRRAT